MKKILSLILALVILFIGCSSVTLVRTETDYLKANEKFKDKNATVSLNNGEVIKATNVVVKTDFVSLLDSESITNRSIPTSEVKEIGLQNINERILKGGVLGFSTLIILGFLLTPFNLKELFKPDALEMELKMGLYGAFLGLLSTGLTFQEDIYRFNNSEPQWPTDGVPEDQAVIEGKVIVISERIGEVMDLQERDQYGLFGYVHGFQSAEFRLHDDGSY